MKKVITYDTNGVENGYLMELKKEGKKTLSYLTVAYPGCFKGYHLHKVRESNYVCIRGEVDILLARGGDVEIINMKEGDSLNIPINVPTGISNRYEESAWLINFPSPAYDPDLTGEQVDIKPEEIGEWLNEQK